MQHSAPKAKAVFLDKDGTLIEDVPYNVDPQRIILTRHAGTGLRLLRDLDYRLFVVSNQAGIAFGRFEESALSAVWQRLNELLLREEVRLTQSYYCPHHPDGTNPAYRTTCLCRKPGAGLLLQAADEHGIDLAQSWMIGDILHDIETGKTAGCRTVLLDNGNETEWHLTPARTPDHIALDLYQAAELIAASQTSKQQPSLAEASR